MWPFPASSAIRLEITDVTKLVGLFVFLFLPAALFAQNAKSAVGGDSSLWAGGEVSYFNAGYSCSSNWVWGCGSDEVGIGALADFNVRPKWGAEGEARWLQWHGAGNEKESDYLIGPRYRAYHIDRFSFWVKALFGGGWITTSTYPAVGGLKGSYFMYAPGGTIDYRLTHRLNVRADYEYQIWPSFEAPTTYVGATPVAHNGPLTPNGFSVGVTYRFLGQ
jgi:hypothetical protein